MKRLIITIAVVAVLCCSANAASFKKTMRDGQSGWQFLSDEMEVFVTETGGHMAPVTFYRNTNPIRPYYISPWQGENLDLPVPVLESLRGDFFCLPFGGNGEEYRKENHPPHGETAGSQWNFESVKKKGDITTLSLSINTTVREGTVTKKLHLVEGHNVIYSDHHIDGFKGKTPLGHHATLAMPEEEGAFKISHSEIQFGYTNPTQFSNPANKEYQQLGINKKFSELAAVPSIFAGAPKVDASRLPQKKGYADLVQLINSEPTGRKPAWLTAVRADEGWLWFSLKDSRVLNSTVIWMENGGRHGSPWLGRNNCVGFEDVTAYFADGIKNSTDSNQLTKEGVQTAIELNGNVNVRYIQGVARIPEGFSDVADVTFKGNEVTFISSGGVKVQIPVHYKFLFTGDLE